MVQKNDLGLSAFDLEYKRRHAVLAGVDEAGRGPLAGPVVASAVILPEAYNLPGLNDSKKLTPQKRDKLYELISAVAIIGIGVVGEKEIDTLNIYQATRRAMTEAVKALSKAPVFLLIDGNMTLDLPIEQKAVVRGDQKSASVAAASIMAKVYRDRWMKTLDEKHPGYFFEKHKGYGTRLHLERLRELGPSPVHRRSFAPVALYSSGDRVYGAKSE